MRLTAAGGFTGAVLDAGCGTGENALHIAALGLPVLGFDVAETALAMARAKAAGRGIEAEFVLAGAVGRPAARRLSRGSGGGAAADPGGARGGSMARHGAPPGA